MEKKPNVILITTDQQRIDSMGCYGSSFVSTPNLDRLASGGALFQRAYCTNPVCTPSRASIYSGRYVGNHGSWNVGTSVNENEKLLSHMFTESGYRTHHIGKAHFQPYLCSPEASRESKEKGWERNFENFTGPYYGFQSVELAIAHSLHGVYGHYGLWVKELAGTTEFLAQRRSTLSFGGEAYDWDMPESLHNSYWTANRTSTFIRDAANLKEPFFLSIGFQDPHHPHALPTERAVQISPDQIPLPQYVEGELNDKPQHFVDVHTGNWHKHHPLHGKFPMAGQSSDGTDYRLVNDKDARLGKAYYYGMVEMIDEAIGRIVTTLEEAGIADNTIIVFTSDHGELLGDHGIWMKGPFHYEQLINVPLLVYWPKVVKPKHHDSIVSLVDLAPTLLSLCGLEDSESMDGVNLNDLLTRRTIKAREHALIECIDDPNKLRLKTIVTNRYKLTVYYGEYGVHNGELYDLHADPGESCNLWHDSLHSVTKSDMMVRLLHELEKIETRQDRIAYA